LNASVTQYAEQIEKLQGELENMAQRAEDKDKMIESLTLQVSRIAKQLDTKDEMINKLLNKYVLND
jgi:chromosome segregation ATPase